MVVPGWGQAANGSYSRAAFYVITEAAAGFMIFKTHRFLGSAREILAARERAAIAGLPNLVLPADTLQAILDAAPGIEGGRSLVDARSQQREDWIAFGVFMLLLNGADAFVSAHLRDFPDPLDVETAFVPGPHPRAEVSVGFRWPGPPRAARAAADLRAARR